MIELLALAVSVAFFPLGLGLMWRGRDAAPVPGGLQPLDTGPGGSCWSEEIRREGALSLGRGLCVNEALIELDKRAARGSFPAKELNLPPC